MITYLAFGQVADKIEVDTTFSSTHKIESITYKTNGKRDKVINYIDGSLSSEMIFKNGVRDGITIFYNYQKKGKVLSKAMYKDGRLNGLSESYNDTGKVISTINYENGLMSGLYTKYFDNGNKSFVYNYKNGKLDGKATTYFKNGKASSDLSYKEGKMDGSFTYYYENGNTKYVGSYKDGKMYGERICYEENGKLSNGNFVIYTDDGLIERECKCINGRPEGDMKVYSNGALYYAINFKNGKPDGLLTYAGTYAKSKKKELYKDGVYVGEIDEDGK